MTEKSNKSVIFVLGGITSGGAERVASRLMQYWTDNDWDITLIAGNKPEDDFYQLPGKVKRIVINTGSPSSNKIVALMKNLPYVWRLRKALKKNKAPNVISFLTRTNVHAILACLGLKKHLIISERNDTTRETHPWPWPVLRKVLYRFADVVTANSEIALTGMKEYIDKDKLKFVPNPVIIPDKQATPQQSNKILNIGRLVPQKAQNLLLEALSLIKERDLKGWSLDILGEGEEKQNLVQLTVELGLGDTVHFRGLIDDPTPFYLNAGIFVLSSRYEGTPNVLLEAMSFGLPCIISDSLPGALELIENNENGLVFKSGEARDLANKLTMLIENPEKKYQIGIQAREWVKKFSPENAMPVWEQLIRYDDHSG